MNESINDYIKKSRIEEALMITCSDFLYEDIKTVLNTDKLVGFEKLPNNKIYKGFFFRIILKDGTSAYRNYNIR